MKIKNLLSVSTALAVFGFFQNANAQTIWTGASGVDTNWTTSANWLPAVVPTAVTNVLFTNTAAVSSPGITNNVVNASTTISNLQYADWAPATTQNYQVTLIGNNNTLTVGNGILVGTGTDPGANTVVNAVISGAGGTLNVTGGNVNIRQGTGTGTIPRPGWAKLDMSQLDTFNANIARFLVAGDGGGSAFNSREAAIVYLAKTNVITATGTTPAINVAQNNSNGAGGNTDPTNVPSYLYLGVTNSIYSDAIKIGADKCAGFMSFNPVFVGGGTPSVLIRGATGSRVTTFSISDHSALGSSNQRSFGSVDFSGGIVDALIDLLYVGRGNNGNNTGTDGRPSANGVLTFSAGKIDLNNAEIGYQNASGNTGYNANGVVNVNGTAVLVVRQSMELSHNSGSGTTSGTLNINGGTVLANFITTGGGTNAITVNNGTLSVTNAVGTPAKPVSFFSITNSTLNLYLLGSTNIVANTLNIGASPVTVNISALPGIAVYPAQFALVKYLTAVNGDPTVFALGTLPAALTNYQGYISNNVAAQRIDLVLTNGPIGVPPMPPKAVTWNGTVSGDWDIVTTNWISSGQPTNYANQTTVPFTGDSVTFNDTLHGTTTVNLTLPLTPASLTVNNSLSNYVFTGSGRISGFITLVKSGTGSLTMNESGGDNYSGGITVNGGSVVLGDASSQIIGDTTIAANSILQIGNNNAGGNVPVGNFTNNGALIFNRSDSALTVSAAIGGAGSLTNNGSGTVTITGTGTFTGPTVVNAGTLALQGANGAASTISSSSGLTINNGSTVSVLSDNSLGNPGTGGLPIIINAGGTLTGNSTSSHIRGPLTLNGGTLAMGGSGTLGNGAWDIHSGVTVNGGVNTSTISALTVIPTQTGGTIFDVASGGTSSGIDLNVTGTLINGTGIHDTGVIKNNTGTMALDNNNTYTNGTTINGGTIQLGESTDSASLTSPFGTGPVVNSGTVNFASSQSVTVSNSISGTGNVTVSSGTAVIAGGNTYTGNTTVDGSTLHLTTGGSIAGSPTLTVNSGTLILDANNGGNPVFNFTNSTLTLGSPGISPDLTVSTANFGGANTINIGTISRQTSLPVVYPLIQYSALNGFGSLSLNPLSGGFSGFLSNDITSQTIYLVINSGPITPVISWNGNVSSDWNTSTLNWLTGAAATNYVDGTIVQFSDLASGSKTVNITAAFSPGDTYVEATNVTYTFTGSGGISGTNRLFKDGNGMLVLDNSGADDFSGGMNISAGTVQIGKYDTSGGLGIGSIANNGNLIFNRANNLIVSNAISGSGNVTQTGTNATLTLSGANSFGGVLMITNNTTLVAANSQALGLTNGPTIIASGSTLDVGGGLVANALNLGAESVTVSGVGSGNGAIVNSGATSQQNALQRVVLAGDTTLGGVSRWDIHGSGSSLQTVPSGSAYKITKVGNNQVSLTGVSVDAGLGDVDIQTGTLSIETSTTGLGNPANTLTVESAGTLQFFGMINQLNKNIVLQSGATINSPSGNNTVIGPMTLNGTANVTVTNSTLTLSNLTPGITGSGTLVKNSTGTLVVNGIDAHSGGTTINDGTFILNSISSDPNNVLTENISQSGSTVPVVVGGNGTNIGPVDIEDTLHPGASGHPSTFGVGSGPGNEYPGTDSALAFNASSSGTPSVIFDLSSSTTIGGGVNDLITVNGDFNGNGTHVKINPLGVLNTSSPYTLVTYSGTKSGGFNSTVSLLTGTSRYGFSLNQGTGNNSQVTLTVSGGPALLKWNNAANDGAWNVQSSQDWFNAGTSANDVFYNSDAVLLDDSIITAANALTTITIPSGIAVSPSVITNNSTTNYTLVGPGKISGKTSIVKTGSSTLIIGMTNDFTGTTTISGGTLTVNNTNALGALTNWVVVTNSGTLDVGGKSFAANAAIIMSAQPIYISGWGVNSNGTIINGSTNTEQNAVQNVTLTSDAAIGGPGNWLGQVDGTGNTGRWDIRGGTPVLSTGGQPFNLYKVGHDQVSLVNVTVDTNLADIIVQNGELGIETGTTLGNPANKLIVQQGAVVEFFGATTTNRVKNFVIYGDGISTNIWNNNGGTTLFGTMMLTNGAASVFQIQGTALTNYAPMSGNGGLIKRGGSPFVLMANETYTGNTTVSAGTLSLAGSSAISGSTNIIVQSGATLDVSGRADGTLTLASGQTLSGSGTVNGFLTNVVGIIAPGTSVATGRLTVTSNATLNGTIVMKLDKTGATNDVLNVGGTVNYGGTLSLTNLSGTLAVNDQFKLFNAATYLGNFISIVPASPNNDPALAWDTSLLNASGILKVSASGPAPQPDITGFSVNGTTLTITATNGSTGGQFILLSSTNVALPLAQWTPVLTNTFDNSGDLNLSTNIINPNNGQQFYILSQ